MMLLYCNYYYYSKLKYFSNQFINNYNNYEECGKEAQFNYIIYIFLNQDVIQYNIVIIQY